MRAASRWLAVAGSLHAVASAAQEGREGSPVELPEPLTQETVRDLVATMSDDQVRALLLERLDAVAAAQASALAEVDLDDRLVGWSGDLLASLVQTVERLPAIVPAFVDSYHTFAAGRGAGSVFVGILVALSMFALAALVAGGVNGLVRGRRAAIEVARPTDLGETVRVLLHRVALDVLVWAAFAISGVVLIELLGRATGTAHPTALDLLQAVAFVSFMWMLARFVFAPTRPGLRLSAIDDAQARYLTRQLLVITLVGSLGEVVRQWLIRYGMAPGSTRLGFWTTLAQYALIVWTLWQGRAAFASTIVGRGDDATTATRRFASAWPLIAITLVVLQWLVVELYVATGSLANLPQAALLTTLLVVLLLPNVDTAIRAVVWHFYPTEGFDGGMREARAHTQAGLVRCCRMLLVIATVGLLASLWGLNLLELAEQGVGAQVAGALVNVLMTAAIAYALWEAIDIYVSRRLAIERAAAGTESGAEEVGGEGAGSGSRLLTLLPIFRRVAQVTLLAMAALAVLGELGVNVTPLLAGAGILGLAVGFGAQTLVKDIVSGVFFLLDDAFRIGEYIDVGGTVGTVERISVRSLRLRHHRGALHTIPYGEIPKLTNYSRDWVIVKLKFRVPFDTDVNKVKKIFKQIGKDLLAHEELGPDFMQPFKSQGVMEVDDIGIVVRGKFMAKPGKQFMIQREVYVRVQQAFDANGIAFARREVTVNMPAGDTPSTDATAAANAAAASAAAAG